MGRKESQGKAKEVQRGVLQGIPQRRQWRRKSSGVRPAYVRNHLERDFTPTEPNTKWVTDITYIRSAEGWLYLCVVVDLSGGKGGRLVQAEAPAPTRLPHARDQYVTQPSAKTG